MSQLSTTSEYIKYIKHKINTHKCNKGLKLQMSNTYTVNRALSDRLNTGIDLLFNIDTGSLLQHFESLHLKAVGNKCELVRQCDICKYFFLDIQVFVCLWLCFVCFFYSLYNVCCDVIIIYFVHNEL